MEEQLERHARTACFASWPLILLCAAVLFPLLMVISISLRPGNFATGRLVPEHISLEHWRFALGLPRARVNAEQKCPVPCKVEVSGLYLSVCSGSCTGCMLMAIPSPCCGNVVKA